MAKLSLFLEKIPKLTCKLIYKLIRSNGNSSNALKNWNLILKVSLKTQNNFFVSPHEILKFRYFTLKIASKCFKLILYQLYIVYLGFETQKSFLNSIYETKRKWYHMRFNGRMYFSQLEQFFVVGDNKNGLVPKQSFGFLNFFSLISSKCLYFLS